MRVTALAGGVGAARFLTGLVRLIREEDLSVIVNTGDDINLFGLHISPDVDIVAYTLAGVVDEEKGWGVRGDSFCCLDKLKRYNAAGTWFNVGDQDLAIHIYRTQRLAQGASLADIAGEVSRSLGLKIKILPMSNDHFETRITTHIGNMHFEEYFVRDQCRDEILSIQFDGVASAKPAPQVLDALLDADRVIVCPSNPIVSIGTILSVKGIREALQQTKARVTAISPIVGGMPLKGPADKMLQSAGLEVSAYSVAKLYADFLDAFVIDIRDAAERTRIEKLGVDVLETNTIMKSLEDKISLAKATLSS
ncbi:MAG: 2-phospho-L-lactate transferase [Candidatus Bathyarchaeota archaeon]|nr:2-phospho-L-lactate transferase [Candidatus Termitimicrobium sp.]